jgi:hypothetical protein
MILGLTILFLRPEEFQSVGCRFFFWQQVLNIWTWVRSNSLSCRRFFDLILTIYTFEEICSQTRFVPKRHHVQCVSLSSGSSCQKTECLETRVAEHIKIHFSGQHNALCLLLLKLAVTVLTWTSSGTVNNVTEAWHPHMSELHVLTSDHDSA